VTAQTQSYPGHTAPMHPHPRDDMSHYRGSGLLEGKRAIVTGGDSGIGRAVSVAFAKEGCDVAVAYLDETEDAARTRQLVEATGSRCVLLEGDLADEAWCRRMVREAAETLGGLDVLVNHAGTQAPADDVTSITTAQLEHTFRVNVYGPFWCTQEALQLMPDGASIINTASINGLRGNASLIDYSASKGAVLALTYALAQSLLDRRIRVNAVAPGPVWTPLIPATFDAEKVAHFGEQSPMGRAAQPDEIAPSYVFFAADRLSSYYTGEVLAPAGGEIHPG
jgi:NAD(P)-dependent dehydrogenase (short-subunit alcohol dehydrogenase family)